MLVYADDAAHSLPEHPLIEITKYRKQRTYSKVFWYFQKLIQEFLRTDQNKYKENHRIPSKNMSF